MALVDSAETRVPDADGWLGVPFVRPTADGGKHDGGPMPPDDDKK